MSGDKYTVLIADDEALARDSIKILLKDRTDCEVIGECQNGLDTLTMIKERRPQIVFLDIQMPGMQGMEVIESLDEKNTPIFIMVTAYDQYALKAFDLNAADYLLKPYSDHRFYKSLEKAIGNLNAGQSQKQLKILKNLIDQINPASVNNEGKLVIKSSGKIQLVAKQDIIYIKASGNYCEIHSKDKKYLMYSSITDLEIQLNPRFFVRIHRSTIVNKEHIKELESHFNGEYIVRLDNDQQLKLSRSYKGNLEALLDA